jgi:hypothetical protein
MQQLTQAARRASAGTLCHAHAWGAGNECASYHVAKQYRVRPRRYQIRQPWAVGMLEYITTVYNHDNKKVPAHMSRQDPVGQSRQLRWDPW